MTTLKDLLRDLQLETLRKAQEAGYLQSDYDYRDHIDDEIYVEQLDDCVQTVCRNLIGGD